jgi:hypothetical protein
MKRGSRIMDMRDFKLSNLELRDLLIPTAVFMGGIVLGRLVGLKPILRGAAATLAIAEAAKEAGLAAGGFAERSAPRRRAVARAARKRTTSRKRSHKAEAA